MLFDDDVAPTTLMYRSLEQLDHDHEEEQQQHSFSWLALSASKPCISCDASYGWLSLKDDDELDAAAFGGTGGLPAKTPAYEVLPECVVSDAIEDDDGGSTEDWSCDSGFIFKYNRPRRKTTATTLTTLDGEEEHEYDAGLEDMFVEDLIVPPSRQVVSQQQMSLISFVEQPPRCGRDDVDAHQKQQQPHLVSADEAIVATLVTTKDARTHCNSAHQKHRGVCEGSSCCCIDFNKTTEPRNVGLQCFVASNDGGGMQFCDDVSAVLNMTTHRMTQSMDDNPAGRQRGHYYIGLNDCSGSTEKTSTALCSDATQSTVKRWSLRVRNQCRTHHDWGSTRYSYVQGGALTHRRAPTSCWSLTGFSLYAGQPSLQLEERGPPAMFLLCVLIAPTVLLPSSSVALSPIVMTPTRHDVSVLPRHHLQNCLHKTSASDAVTTTLSLTGFASVNFTVARRHLLMLKGFFFANLPLLWRRFSVWPSFASLRIFMSMWFLLLLHQFP